MASSRRSLFSRVLGGQDISSSDSVVLTSPSGEITTISARKLKKTIQQWGSQMHWDPDKSQLLGSELLQFGFGEQAYEVLRSAHKEYPKNIPLAIKAAETALSANLLDRARFEYLELRKRTPNDEKVVMGLALVYAGQDDVQAGISLLLDALSKNPGSVTLWDTLLQIQLSSGVEDEVLLNFENQLQPYDNQAAPYLALAHHYENNEKEKEADKWISKSEEIAPENSNVIRTRLRFSAVHNRPDEVILAGEKLLAQDIFDEEDLVLLFNAYLERKNFGDSQGALSLLELRFPETAILPLKRKLIVATRPAQPGVPEGD